jgi:outer membrane protein TolC
MHREPRSTRAALRSGRHLLIALFVLAMSPAALPAQEKTGAPAAAPPPLTLDECLALTTNKQPALAAARASLAAAEDGRQALDNLPLFARALSRELPIRKEQACLGVTIANALLLQAEWEARYAVTRNFFSITYARMQLKLLTDVLEDLDKARKKTEKLLKAGNPDFKVTQLDLDLFDVNIDILKARQAEARVGVDRAFAALREAIGIGPDYPLDIVHAELPPRVASLDRAALIQLALSNRGEIVQANAARTVTALEVDAQASHLFGLKVDTFGRAADIHAQPIPQGQANGEYRPGAIGLEMPNTLVGKRGDRVARASDLSQRATAVVDKAFNLVALETDSNYLKWLEARDRYDKLAGVLPKAQTLKVRSYKRLEDGNAPGAEYIQTATLVDQIQAQKNEQLYLHALALAALERVTAGGYRIYPTKQP